MDFIKTFQYTNMRNKKGWFRLTWFISIMGGFLVNIHQENRFLSEDSIFVHLVFIVFTWIVYFSIIWIAKGFSENAMTGIRSVGIHEDPKTMNHSIITLSRGYKDSTIYEGSFDNGLFTGRGIFTFLDGRKYEGQIKDNKPHGLGILYPPQDLKGGIIYEGVFQDGKFMGFKKADTKKYEFRPG